MLKSVSDLRTLGSLLRVNQTFYHAYKNESKALLLSTASKEYGDLLDPMIEIAGSILNESAILPLFQRHQAQQLRDTTVFNPSLIKTLLEIDSVLDTWLRIYEYRGPLGLLNYREMFPPPSPSSTVGVCAYTFYRFHISESSEREYLRFKDVLLSYWSYSIFHRSVEQYWCICCGPQLPSMMGAFDHLSVVKLFQLQSMYDFMYAVVSSIIAGFRLEVHLDASKHIYYLSLRNDFISNIAPSWAYSSHSQPWPCISSSTAR